MKYKCLSIAGFDGSGGAGIQADLKTFSATGSYGMTVLTALPVQNTCGVRECYAIPQPCIESQLNAIFDDIVPDAIKIGMLFSEEIIQLVYNFLKNYYKKIPIILDPVMIAKSGDLLLKKNAIDLLKKKLIPLAQIITPNLPEANALIKNKNENNKKILARRLLDLGCHAVLLKGGHENTLQSEDLFLSQKETALLSSDRVNSKNTHGTGCTLSAAITSFVAQNYDCLTACKKAKTYLSGALSAAKNNSVGKGYGPVHHFYQQWAY